MALAGDQGHQWPHVTVAGYLQSGCFLAHNLNWGALEGIQGNKQQEHQSGGSLG